MAWTAWIESIPSNYMEALNEYRLPLLLSAIVIFCFGLWKVSEVSRVCRNGSCVLTKLQFLTITDIPYINGIPEIPGALPVVGHLLDLGDDHATICEKWWKKYKVRTLNSDICLRLRSDKCW